MAETVRVAATARTPSPPRRQVPPAPASGTYTLRVAALGITPREDPVTVAGGDVHGRRHARVGAGRGERRVSSAAVARRSPVPP